MTEKTAVLGSTGSVGRQALDVCRHRNIKVTALSAGSNISLLEEQIREFSPGLCAVADERAAADLAVMVADTGTRIISGKNSAEVIASEADADTVLNSVSGIAGLRPTLAAIRAGKNLALANKESLVTYGKVVMAEAERRGVMILPVDSEHSAVFQCLSGQKVKKIILTASGGPFFGKKREELARITPADALAHPTWSMGNRITIDSATLMNKGFEVIEAVMLFGVTPEQVDVVVHRESIIHSMVEYTDNAVIAQMGAPDMRLCVQYALTYPERYDSPVVELDLVKLSRLTFAEPDGEAFPLLPLAYRAVKRGGVVPAVMNGADEAAVAMFLDGRISFTDISDIVSAVTENAPEVDCPTLEDIEAADREARRMAAEMAAGRAGV